MGKLNSLLLYPKKIGEVVFTLREHAERWCVASGTMDSHLLVVSGVSSYVDSETKMNPR